MRAMNATPHVAANYTRPGGNAIDWRTARHAGYWISQQKRKRIEEVFGWLKTVAILRKTRHRGLLRAGWLFTFAAAAYNLVRMRNLLSPAVRPAYRRGEVCPDYGSDRFRTLKTQVDRPSRLAKTVLRDRRKAWESP